MLQDSEQFDYGKLGLDFLQTAAAFFGIGK
jgi:hypothetical protein